MMKKIFYLFALLAGFSFLSCSEDEEYNPDKAQSNYTPVEGRKVASLHTTNTLNGRDYSWKHNFSYDAQGRIKEVNSVIKHHHKYEAYGGVFYRECNITSKAKYYFDKDEITVKYTVNKEYPDYPDWNTKSSYTDSGVLNENGYIKNYVSNYFKDGVVFSLGFECEYKMNNLYLAHFDGGFNCEITRDGNGDVDGYIYSGSEDEQDSDKSHIFRNEARNRTNFDFSAYFGYWGHERYIGAMTQWPYAHYQLAAFGFFGTANRNLPLWQKSVAEGIDQSRSPWKMEGNYPVKYTDPAGYVTEVTYVD